MTEDRKYAGYFMLVLKFLVPSLIFMFILRGFILIPVPVDGNSMEQTLEQGDMVLMEKFSAIQRFDVIVFQLPNGEVYIKRVIGLPGETVTYDSDQLYINNEPVAESFLKNNMIKDHERASYTTDFDLVTLIKKETLPENSYFVLGDNRRMSKDSRSFGVVKEEYILGKAQVVYYPLTHMKIIPR